MSVTFKDLQDPGNPRNDTKLASSRETLAILDELVSTREPFFCSLRGAGDHEVLIGVGEPGCVQFSASDGSPPYQMAVAQPIEATFEYVEFLTGGTPSPVPREYCVPWEIVRSIVAHYFETGDASPAVRWETI